MRNKYPFMLFGIFKSSQEIINVSKSLESNPITNKRVLCYGDSITWGYNPADGLRMNDDQRWTGVLKNGLGEGYTVIEEGLNGRTTVWDDPLKGTYKNGLNYLVPCLASQRPLDFVVLLLGTNDSQEKIFNACNRNKQGY